MQAFGDGSFPYGLGRMVSEEADGLADGVVRQLELAVTVGLLSDGERLPTEVRLAELLGVSTVTLRQGLATLRSRGVIETRRGRGGGSYIRDVQAASSDRATEQLRARSVEELRDLGDACAAVAGMSARLAASRGLSSEIDRLADLAEVFASAGSGPVRRRADSRFHIEVAVVGQSARLARMMVGLQGEFAALRWDPCPDEASAETVRQHCAIVDSIRAGDPELAQRLAQEHIAHETRVVIDHHLRVAAS